MNAPLSLFDRVWARHVIVADVIGTGGEELLFVDRNLVHDGSTFLAFDQNAQRRPCRAQAEANAGGDGSLSPVRTTRHRARQHCQRGNPPRGRAARYQCA